MIKGAPTFPLICNYTPTTVEKHTFLTKSDHLDQKIQNHKNTTITLFYLTTLIYMNQYKTPQDPDDGNKDHVVSLRNEFDLQRSLKNV